MYFNVTKSFLNALSLSTIKYAFIHKNDVSKSNKKELIESILKLYTEKVNWGDGINKSVVIYLCCPYCKTTEMSVAPKKFEIKSWKYCTNCGRIKPALVFKESLNRNSILVKLASKMNTKEDLMDKSVLLEQSIVSLATSCEVLLRESYSLIKDLKHVIYGESIFDITYKETKNDFTNISTTTNNFKKLCGLNLKEELSEIKYNQFRTLYSIRHIIVHNSGIKDREYISQTGENASLIGSRIELSVTLLRKYIRSLNTISNLMDKQLRVAILKNLEASYSLISTFNK